MLIVRLAGDPTAVHLAVADDVFDGVFLGSRVSREISWTVYRLLLTFSKLQMQLSGYAP